MKKILLIAIIIFVVLSGTAYAFDNPLAYDSFAELIDHIIDFFFNVALLAAPLTIIVGAFYFITAGGDPTQIQTGKTLIKFALIGFLIILISKGLINIIMEDILEIDSATSTTT